MMPVGEGRLAENAHRCDCAETGNDSTDTVCKNTALDSRVEKISIDLQSRDVACRCNVTNCFHWLKKHVVSLHSFYLDHVIHTRTMNTASKGKTSGP